MKNNNFKTTLDDLSQSIKRLKSHEKIIYKSAEIMNKTFKKNKVIFCGNGGSAADSSHATKVKNFNQNMSY